MGFSLGCIDIAADSGMNVQWSREFIIKYRFLGPPSVSTAGFPGVGVGSVFKKFPSPNPTPTPGSSDDCPGLGSCSQGHAMGHSPPSKKSIMAGVLVWVPPETDSESRI